VLPTVESGTSLSLVHGTGNDAVTIFPHNQVWFELYSKYTQWAFLADPLSNPMTAFLACYTNFKANMGEGFWRMYDALERQYNPIENYSMIEAGADGHKQSKKTTEDGGTNTTGDKLGTSSSTRSGNQALEHGHAVTGTHTGSVTTDTYKNAFDSGISADGTHVEKVVVNPSAQTDSETNSGTDTTRFNNVKDEVSHSHDVSDTEQDGIGAGWDNVHKEKRDTSVTEEFEDNKSLSFKRTNPDGTDTTETLGSDFSDGTMYRHTRSGNIGVTTAQAMLTEELELRKRNLLSEWVQMFLREYFTLVWDGEE